MKNLVINAISALRGGGQTNIINLCEYLHLYDVRLVLIVNTKNKDIFLKYQSDKLQLFEASFASKTIFHRIFWEKYILSSKLKEWNTDIYYTPGGTLTTQVPTNCIAITTLQNMLPFDDTARTKFPFFSYLRHKLLLLRYVFLKSYKLADKVIFISNYSRDVVKTYINNIEEKSTIIPLGVNENFLHSSEEYILENNLFENEFYLYVSILDYYKAQKELIYTWKKLVDSGFYKPLVLAGPNVNQYGNEVIQLVKELDLENHVFYVGMVKYKQLPNLYKKAKALIFASSCECCPNILLEKMSMGKPLYCSNIEPMPEFAEDGAIYFNPYDEDSLYNSIVMNERNQALLDKISKKCLILSKKYENKETILKLIEYILGIKSEK